MNKRALASVAAVLLSTTLTAQQTAPGNESITQADLRADLFFLAGDAMRGRLTDTNENRATADYIRARFERAGLKPAAGNSLFHNYNLMTATLGEGNSLSFVTSYAATQIGRRARVQERPGVLSAAIQRQRHAPPAASCSPASASSRRKWNHDDYKDGVRGNIVMVLDHEPGERDPKSPFEGVVTAEPAAAWRKALAAQEKGAIGILFVSDVHNHPDPANFEQAARNFWPATPARIPELHARHLGGSHPHSRGRRSRRRWPRLLIAGTGKTLEELAKRAETAGGITPDCRSIATSRSADRRRSPHRSRSQRAWPDRRQRSEAEGRVGARDGALRSRRRQRHADPQRRRRQRLGHRGAARDRRRLCARRAAGPAAEAQRAVRGVEFRGARPARRVGLHRASAGAAREHRRRAEHGHDRPQRRSAKSAAARASTASRCRPPESNANAVNMMGFARAPELAAVVDAANAGIGLDIKKRYDNNTSNLVRRSDQWPFLQRGVPALGFMTGLHPDYHTMYDRPEKINYVKMEKIARLIHQASWNLANAAARSEELTTLLTSGGK